METPKHVFTNRTAVRPRLRLVALGRLSLIAAAFAFGVSSVHAGYSNLTPPPGSTVEAGQLMQKTIGNAQWSSAKTLAVTAEANVGGRAVSVAALLRMAPSAGLAVARFAFSWPVQATVAAIAGAYYLTQWADTKGYFIKDQAWYKRDQTCIANVCYQYRPSYDGYSPNDPWFGDIMGACQAMVGKTQFGRRVVAVVDCRHNAGGIAAIGRFDNGGQDGLSISTRQVSGNTSSRKATATEFEEDLKTQPMPQQVPKEIGAPVPVELPTINPSPAGVPQPLRVPVGSPTAIPNTDPQQYRQPVITITPAPTNANPWQVDQSPSETVSTDPDGIKTPTTPDTDSPPTEPSESDLCTQYPDILACSKPELDTPDGEIPKDSKTITYAEESLFGSGSCPANLQASIGTLNKSVTVWDWQKTCQYALPLRAIVVALATFAAFLIVMPGGGNQT